MLVEVSTNGREYTSSGVQFELVSVMMQDLTPWCGPVLGGTVVTIAGTGLSSGTLRTRCIANLVMRCCLFWHPLTALTAFAACLRRRCLTVGRTSRLRSRRSVA